MDKRYVKLIIILLSLCLVIVILILFDYTNKKNELLDKGYTNTELKESYHILDFKNNYNDLIKERPKSVGTNIYKDLLNDIVLEYISNKENKTIDLGTDAKTEDGINRVDYLVIVNKKHPLPSDYAPGEDAEAGSKIREMISAMQAAGLNVSSNYSGYRSYEYQSTLYNNYVSSYGQSEAERFSARPGYSEHQTGMAFDLLTSQGNLIGDSQADSAEVAWIAQNAHNYGFIIRYPETSESITGYLYEPWHLRYVGYRALAIYQSGLTLEEYYGFEGGTSY